MYLLPTSRCHLSLKPIGSNPCRQSKTQCWQPLSQPTYNASRGRFIVSLLKSRKCVVCSISLSVSYYKCSNHIVFALVFSPYNPCVIPAQIQLHDVTMAIIDINVAHIKIKLPKCWNPIRPPDTMLTSNGRQICIQATFWVNKYKVLCHLSWAFGFITSFGTRLKWGGAP